MRKHVKKAADLDAVGEAPSKEVAIAKITTMTVFSKQAMNLPLSVGWKKISSSSFALVLSFALGMLTMTG